ncbi:MAG: phosphoserine phosphatase [Chlamydiales bacterium]|jgi:phosphoserine phosphatase
MNEQRPLFIFDLDHTLFHCNSSFHFGRYLFHQNHLSVSKVLYCIGCYACHRYGGMSVGKLHEKTLACIFQATPTQILRERVNFFLDSHINEMLNPTIMNQLEECKKRGVHTLLLSSSPDFLVGPIAERLGFNQWRATEYLSCEKQNISHLGLVITGEVKAQLANEFRKSLGISVEKITALTDSFLDIPLLRVVGKAIAVNPDKLLLREAKKEGWEILS